MKSLSRMEVKHQNCEWGDGERKRITLDTKTNATKRGLCRGKNENDGRTQL